MAKCVQSFNFLQRKVATIRKLKLLANIEFFWNGYQLKKYIYIRSQHRNNSAKLQFVLKSTEYSKVGKK